MDFNKEITHKEVETKTNTGEFNDNSIETRSNGKDEMPNRAKGNIEIQDEDNRSIGKDPNNLMKGLLSPIKMSSYKAEKSFKAHFNKLNEESVNEAESHLGQEDEVKSSINLYDSPVRVRTKSMYKKLIDKGNQYKQNANRLFQRNKIVEAKNEYTKAINEYNGIIYSTNSTEIVNMANINSSIVECLNGLAWCNMIFKEYDQVLEYTRQVFLVNSNNFIALSFRSKALSELGKYKEALETIKQALSIKYSKSLVSLMREIEEKIKLNESCLSVNKVESQNKIHNETKLSTWSQIIHVIMKFMKVLKSYLVNFTSKHRYKVMLILIAWVIIFRKRFKDKLLGVLKINF